MRQTDHIDGGEIIQPPPTSSEKTGRLDQSDMALSTDNGLRHPKVQDIMSTAEHACG
jgi:hypothetical protein